MSNQIQINFNGFSTRVFLNEEKMSATNISLTTSENLIQFEGAYGGDMNYGSERNYFRLNAPSFYELPEISCSLGCELTYEQILSFFKFLENRGGSQTIEISSGKSGNKTFYFDECYVKSMSLYTSENSLVTADYDFYINSDSLLNEEIKNDVERTHKSKDGECIFDMKDKDKTPVGYWETSIEGFGGDNGTGKHVLDWSLTVSQNVIPKYYCGRNSDDEVVKPLLPDIMIGYPKMELKVTFLMDKDGFDEDIFFNFPKSFNLEESDSSKSKTLSLFVRDKKICDMLYGKVVSYAPSLSSNGGITFTSTYIINQIQLH